MENITDIAKRIYESGLYGGSISDIVDELSTFKKECVKEIPLETVVIQRVWAMPNGLTFTIKPIRELLNRYIKDYMVVIDPFANNSEYGTITNDLNEDYKTDYHLDALEFLRLMPSSSCDVVLYDPPYSITQAAQLYKSYGKKKLEINVANMKYWAECKNEVARILKTEGIAITFGWNTNGIGKNRNFRQLEILIVAHGGSKNDTLVTIESKVV